MSVTSKITRLEELRALISRRAPGAAAAEACPLGLPAIDAALGGGLPRGCLQEVIPADDGAAAAGFAAFLLGRLAAGKGAVLWASLGEGDLYPPGLAGFGLDPAKVILLSAPSAAELLWALEEALRSRTIAGALGEVDRLDLTASRRLQLAAGAGGGVGLLLMRADRSGEGRLAAVSAAALRWRVGAKKISLPPCGGGLGWGDESANADHIESCAISDGAMRAISVTPTPPSPLKAQAFGLQGEGEESGAPRHRWRVELLRQRAGRPGAWILEREDETDRLLVAAELGDGSVAQAARFSGR
jgi:protein ImuA